MGRCMHSSASAFAQQGVRRTSGVGWERGGKGGIRRHVQMSSGHYSNGGMG